jgi:hypothetical protein
LPVGFDEADDLWDDDDDERDEEDEDEEELLGAGEACEGVGSGRRRGDGRKGVGQGMNVAPAVRWGDTLSSGDCIVMSLTLLEGRDDCASCCFGVEHGIGMGGVELQGGRSIVSCEGEL